MEAKREATARSALTLALLIFLGYFLMSTFVAAILNEIVKQGKGAKHNEEGERKAVKRVSPELFLPAIPYPYAKQNVGFPVR